MEFLNEIWQTISRNPKRSVVTAFGVAWGMFMLVVLAGLGAGIGNMVVGAVSGTATNSAIIFPGMTSVPYRGFQAPRSWDMKTSDIAPILSSSTDIEYLVPNVQTYGVDIEAVGSIQTTSASIFGTTADYIKCMPLNVIKGRFVNEVDVAERRKVCVLGQKTASALFPRTDNPCGEYIRYYGTCFQVVGVSKSSNDNISFGGENDSEIFFPFTTIQQLFNWGETLGMLMVTAKEKSDIEDVLQQVEAVLRERHNISPDDRAAIVNFNFKKMFDSVRALSIGINLLIWIVGLGTLFTGIIGVSNIMLITVKERKQEIGVRRALGASPATIIRQVMAESFVLTALAGVVGLLAGIGIIGLVGKVMSMNPELPLQPQVDFASAFSALIVLLLAGLAAGFLPARRAIEIKAVEALQDE